MVFILQFLLAQLVVVLQSMKRRTENSVNSKVLQAAAPARAWQTRGGDRSAGADSPGDHGCGSAARERRAGEEPRSSNARHLGRAQT